MEETLLKSSHYPRTDQFAVARQLEGLQEKFQVLNRDELATQLGTCLIDLDNYRSSLFPEILSLFSQLSDRPALQPQLERTVRQKPIETEETHSWTELDASGTAYREDDIWQDVDFGAGSSEDDISSVSSEGPAPRVLPQDSVALEEEYVIPDELFSSGEDEALIVSIRSVQFWKDENNQVLTHKEANFSRPITELQIIRETIFMLQGLPTSLFWRLDDSVQVDRRYALAHSSKEALSSLLQSFGLIGAQVDSLRQFTKFPQTVPYVQGFLRGIEDLLRQFDTFLSETQTQYLSQTSTATVSLVQLLEDVRRESKLLLSLADVVSFINCDASGRSVRCLDLLYDLVCMTQAVGDDAAFQSLAELFFSCFESYIRPIRLWMETGHLNSVEETFFIIENHKDRDLRTLWRDWYALDESSRLPNAPKFIKNVAHRVFTTGKNMVFLRHLNAIPTETETLQKATLTFKDLYPHHSTSALSLPFSVQLESAFEKFIHANYSTASDLLRTALDQQCGLWTSLQALEYIFLCKDMSIFSIIDHKIFDSIDRGRGAWNDRFLLTELAQGAFSVIQHLIDPSRLIVRSAKVSPRDPNVQSRSVKILKALSFDYILPWPVANIITKDAIVTYQHISIFLMQIRRAKYMIVKQRLQYSDTERTPDGRDNKLGYAVRHKMLWFLNVLYGHITDLVISITTSSMRKDISSSKDLDAMTAIHHSYMSSMEAQCLLSRNLDPLYEAIINLLDLCVRFADIQTMHCGENEFDQTDAPRNGKTSKKGDNRHEDDESDEDEEGEEEEGTLEQGNTAKISLQGSYSHQLSTLKDQFDQLVAFLTAGLKSVARVNGQVSWEILAEKLEWRKERLIF